MRPADPIFPDPIFPDPIFPDPIFHDPIFHNDDAASAYVAACRWPNGPACPICFNAADIVKTAGDPGRYSCRACGQSFTVASGSMMAKSAIPLRKWLRTFHLLGGGDTAALATAVRGLFSVSDNDPDLRLLVDGRVIRPSLTDHLTYVFALTERPADVRILSRHVVPTKHDPSQSDGRRLGVSLRSIAIQTDAAKFEWSHDDPALLVGFHKPEPGRRWTNGRALIPAAYFSKISGSFTLKIQLGSRELRYPTDIAHHTAPKAASEPAHRNPGQTTAAPAMPADDQPLHIPLTSGLLVKGWHEPEYTDGYFRWMGKTASITNPDNTRPLAAVELRVKSVYGDEKPRLTCSFDGELGKVDVVWLEDISQWCVRLTPNRANATIDVVVLEALKFASPANAEGAPDQRQLSVCVTDIVFEFEH